MLIDKNEDASVKSRWNQVNCLIAIGLTLFFLLQTTTVYSASGEDDDTEDNILRPDTISEQNTPHSSQEKRLKSEVGQTVNDISIWFESLGDEAAATVMLVMGQGGQAVSWDDEFCRSIVKAGYRVVRFDNRDSGLSGTSTNTYLIEHMAIDAISVLDELQISSAHIVGQSMGGMIAQQMAIDHPDRVLSLSLLSTSPDISIAPPDPRIAKVSSDLDVSGKDDWIEAAVESIRVQTGSRWEFDEMLIRDRVNTAVERSFRPEGAIRQVQAILASPPRTSRLSTLDTPTIVVHGEEDPILTVAHAKVLARAIPKAKLHIIEGMGHAVPWGHWDLILPLLLEHFHQVSG